MNFLVATDFSTRSDRAMRRSILVAKHLGATLSVVHVVDDDQPRRVVKTERETATGVLNELARALEEEGCPLADVRVVEGDAFQGITQTADDMDADLVVLGPHRRQLLKDVFVGTTAERVVRSSRRPVIMANGVPTGFYQRVLVATDFSQCSADALSAITHMKIDRTTSVAALHVFEPIGETLLTRASVSEDTRQDYLEEEELRAIRELDEFLANAGFTSKNRFVRKSAASVVATILGVVKESSADLLVLGTRGRTGVERLLLGSVAQEVLAAASIDVLIVPPSE